MMTPPEATAVISDLHLSLGKDWSLEDFRSDAQMAALVELLRTRFQDRRLDLVLLGDIFDLWQSVPKSDLTAGSSSAVNPSLDIQTIRQDLGQVMMNHREFFEALGKFSGQSNNRLVIVAGNHDHSLIDHSLQGSFKSILLNDFGFNDAGDNLIFPENHFYFVPELRLYAEHGNQYDKFNAYRNFLHFGTDPRLDECQGYGFVRLFFNRLENLDPDIDDTPEHWGDWFNWLRRNLRWNTIRRAWPWYQQYLGDPRIDPIRISDSLEQAALTVSVPAGEPHPLTPDILLNGQDKNPNMLFSSDLATEAAYRRLYQDDQGFKSVADDILRQKFSPNNPPEVNELPDVGNVPELDLNGETKIVRPVAGNASSLLLGEPLMRSLQGMFTPGQGPNLFRDDQGHRTHLDTKICHLIIMGHTHEPKWETIPNFSEKLYINSGTWITRTTNGGTKAERTVVLTEKLPNGEIWAEMGVITDANAYQQHPNRRRQLPH